MAFSMSKACISSIKDILMCAVCLEDVKEPRTLVCHHSFCMSCLKSIELTGRGVQQKLQCPKCRKYTNVPRGIVSYLPRDCKLNELSELYNQVAELKVSQSVRCEATQPAKHGVKQLSGNEESPAVEPETSQVVQPIVCVACTGPIDKNELFFYYYYCNSCHDYLCMKCTTEHKETPLFKDHDLINLVGKFVVHRKLCQEHSLKSKDYHCEDCKQLVCSVCVTKNHREHTVRHFEEYDGICRREIAKQSLKLFAVFHVPIYFQLCRFNDVSKPLMTCLDLRTDEITKKISEVANTITMDIERQKHELTDLVKKQRSTIQKILSAHILYERCEGLRWCKDPGVLLNEHQKLSEEVCLFIDENGDEEISELTIDSDLIDGFSTETQGISIGSLSTKTLKEFISEHKLAGNR